MTNFEHSRCHSTFAQNQSLNAPHLSNRILQRINANNVIRLIGGLMMLCRRRQGLKMELLGQLLANEARLIGLMMTGEMMNIGMNIGRNAGDDGNYGGHRAKLGRLIGRRIGFVYGLQLPSRGGQSLVIDGGLLTRVLVGDGGGKRRGQGRRRRRQYGKGRRRREQRGGGYG